MALQRLRCPGPPRFQSGPHVISVSEPQAAGFVRRLAALVYDGMLLFAVLFFATLALMPFTHGAIASGNVTFSLYLLSICLAFYAGFWTHGGQTLGMKTWRLRVQQADGRPITLRQALVRFFASLLALAPAGLGYLWILVDKDKKAWHDRLSGTVVIYRPKPK